MTSIILNSREVRGILDGSVKMLVRPMNPQPTGEVEEGWYCDSYNHTDRWNFWTKDGKFVNTLGPSEKTAQWKSPFGSVGKKLWCKEVLANDGDGDWMYRADRKWIPHYSNNWRDLMASKSRISSSNMPQWASRLTIETKSVRVVMVQEMSEEDAVMAGAKYIPCKCGQNCHEGEMKREFKDMWQSTYGKKYPYETNPYVFLGEIGRVA